MDVALGDPLPQDPDSDFVIVNIVGDWAPASGETAGEIGRTGRMYYGPLAKWFDTGDLNVVNVETVVVAETPDIETAPRTAPCFVDSMASAKTLRDAGVNLACLANNHSFDADVEGLSETQRCLSALGICSIGAGIDPKEVYRPYVFQRAGVRLAIFNVADGIEGSERYNNGIGIADIESYKLWEAIVREKSLGSVVIVIAHAGAVFCPVPPPFLQRLYRQLLDQGADAVVGHHPHVVQGYEVHDGRPIFYSVGHFGIHRRTSRTAEQIGIMVNLKICSKGIRQARISPFFIERSCIRALTESERIDFALVLEKLCKALGRDMLEAIWHEYIRQKPPILTFLRIVIAHVANAERADQIVRGQALSMVNRFMINDAVMTPRIPTVNYDDKMILDIYGFGWKRLPWSERIFLMGRNSMSWLRVIWGGGMRMARNIKRRWI